MRLTVLMVVMTGYRKYFILLFYFIFISDFTAICFDFPSLRFRFLFSPSYARATGLCSRLTITMQY